MITVRRASLDRDTARLHSYVTEASDQHPKWINWPHTFEVEGKTLGNGLPFDLVQLERDREGEVTAALYRQQCGIVMIRIFND